MERIHRSWSDLPSELLEFIVLKLSIVDVQRFKSVCSSWHDVAKIYPSGPFLMLPFPEETNEQRLQLLSVFGDKKVVYTAENNLEKLVDDGRCYGSSHGWLVVLDKFANPWLLNLFSGREIELPGRETFPHIDSVCIDPLDDQVLKVRYKAPPQSSPVCQELLMGDFRNTLIEKAILTANPSYDENYKVIIIYSSRSSLAFCNGGDTRWTFLSNSGIYLDVVCHDNTLYALLNSEGIEVWDLKDSVPKKKMSFGPSYRENFELSFPFDDVRSYLVPSKGEILVIKRYIGYFDDELDEDSECVVLCPYRTLKFKILKLDSDGETLLEVKSLQDEALFVGGNQTFAVSTKDFEGLKRDSVYFTDNYWSGLNAYYLYGGYDTGIFDLEKGSVDMLCDLVRIEPAPVWVLPL